MRVVICLITALALPACSKPTTTPPPHDTAPSAKPTAAQGSGSASAAAPSADGSSAAPNAASPSTATPSQGAAISVTTLRGQAPQPGPKTYRLQAYVVKTYSCPPCPKGAMCKPCMGDNIVLSDDPTLHEHYDLDDRDVIVFTTTPKDFELGTQVTVTIKVLDRQASNRGIHDLELVAR